MFITVDKRSTPIILLPEHSSSQIAAAAGRKYSLRKRSLVPTSTMAQFARRSSMAAINVRSRVFNLYSYKF